MTGVPGVRASPVDLHLHTCFSDGDDDPTVLADRCVAAAVRTAAIVDHDSMAAVAAFETAARGRLTVVPGCEITATDGGIEAHCLAYWVEGPDFLDRIGRVRTAELAWWRAWVGAVEAFGVPLTWDDVETELGVDRIGYVGDYLALLLRAAGDDARFTRYANDTRALVADLCKPGGPLYLPRPWVPDLDEAVGWVLAAGGTAVLAHPEQGRGVELDRDLLRRLRDCGIAGIEVWTTWHTAEQSARLAALCAESGLIAVAGSDYHGTRVKPWASTPGLLPAAPADPFAVVDALHARCGGAS